MVSCIHILYIKLSWFTLASTLLFAAATPLETNTIQNKWEYLNLTVPFEFGSTGIPFICDPKSFLGQVNPESTQIQVFSSSSSTMLLVNNNSIYAYSNYSWYIKAGARKVLSNKVHAALNLRDDDSQMTIATTSEMHSSWRSHISRYSSANEAVAIGNISLLAMYFWLSKRLFCDGIPSKSSLFFPSLFMVANTSGTRQPYYGMHLSDQLPRHSLIELGTHKSDQSYTRSIKVYRANFILGLGFCCLFLVFGITGIYSSVKRHKLVKQNSNFFQKNGGLLLEEHINASNGGATIFKSKDLEMAVGYHKKKRLIICQEDDAVDRFVNEIITLTKIDHQNVVKFLGCCLETEAPILVYELASNGALFDYIHCRNGKRSLPWDVLLKIASESADGLSYLHSASLIHGNVKSSNILLSDLFVARVAGFRPSRLYPTSESQISSLLQRTLGYLDPEYLHKGQLTYKSDVYSFGTVLLEIVTGEKPISFGRPESQRIISSHFVSSMESKDGLFDQIVRGTQVFVKQGHREEQVVAIAELAKRCLSLSSAERPTMEEVASELNMLRSTDSCAAS